MPELRAINSYDGEFLIKSRASLGIFEDGQLESVFTDSKDKAKLVEVRLLQWSPEKKL